MNVVVIALGSNLPVAGIGGPIRVLDAALWALEESGLGVLARSRWYWSAPVPPSLQPLFVNGVVAVHGIMDPVMLLQQLQAIEQRFERVRTAVNQSRTLDLDLLDYAGRILRVNEPQLTLPHPRLHQRAFVLRPLAEVCGNWRHPVLRLSAQHLLSRLDADQWLLPIKR